MQREGEPDERNATGASRRDPPIIEGEAKEIDSSPVAAPEPTGAPEDASPLAGEEAAQAATASEVASEEPAAPTERRSRSGRVLALIGIPVLVIAGGVTWLAAPGARAPSDIRARIIAHLPQGAQKALGVAPKTEQSTPVEAKAIDNKPAPGDAQSRSETQAAAPAQTTDDKRPPVAREEAPATPAESAQQKTATAGETTAPQVDAAKPAPAAADTAPATQSESAGGSDAAALGARIDALNNRLDALAAPSAAQAALAAKTDDLATKLDRLNERLAALETKLSPPKSDQRAPEARENGEATSAQSTAARIVVAQSLAQALASGAPLEGAVAALRTLGVGDEKLADFSPYLKAGAPGLVQLSAQWTALRTKILGADRPEPDATWSGRLLGKLRGMVQIDWAGKGDASAFGVFGAVEAALKRGDLAGAIKASDALREGAKSATAEWRAAATQKLKAETAAQAILSDSMAAIARPKS
jgi:ribonuclease E